MAQYRFERLEKEYDLLWQNMEIVKATGARNEAKFVIKHKERYQRIEKRTGVPWFVIGCIHLRESGRDDDFSTWLHNGDPMRDSQGRPIQTVHDPANRPPNPGVTFDDGAYDALVVCEHFNEVKSWGPARVAYVFETMNGFGYRAPSRNIPSPYLWGGTNIQKPGKFIHDGPDGWRPEVVDQQVGAMAVLRAVMDADPDAYFEDKPIEVHPNPSKHDMLPPKSPKAEDTETSIPPLTRSKTIWGQILGLFGAVGGIVSGFFDKLDNPYTLTAFVLILGVVSFGAYMVFKGRVDMQKLAKHLAPDDSETPTSSSKDEDPEEENKIL